MVNLLMGYCTFLGVLGIGIGYAAWCWSDYTWKWIVDSYRKRNLFGIIIFSIWLVIISPAVLASLLLQGIIEGILWIIRAGMKGG